MTIRRFQHPAAPSFALAAAVCLALGILSGFPVQAEPPAPPPSAGIVDYQPFLKFADEDADIVEINISGSLLRALAGGVSAKEEPELQGLLKNLHAISALVVAVLPQQEEAAARFVEARGNDLRQKGWEEVAKVRKKGEKIRVLALNQGNHIGGLVVMVLSREVYALEEGDQTENKGAGHLHLVFANIAGQFSLEQLQQLEGKMEIPGLDSVLEDKEKEKGKPSSRSLGEPVTPEDPSPDLGDRAS